MKQSYKITTDKPPPSVKRLYHLIGKSAAPVKLCGPFYHAEPKIVSSFDFSQRGPGTCRVVLIIHTNRSDDTIEAAFMHREIVDQIRPVCKPAIPLSYLLHHGVVGANFLKYLSVVNNL